MTAKYMGKNNYEVKEGKVTEIIHVSKNQAKFSRSIREAVESFQIQDENVEGRLLVEAIQAITTKKIPEFSN